MKKAAKIATIRPGVTQAGDTAMPPSARAVK